MSEMEFENKIRSLAQGMEYPHTPNVVGSVMRRLHTPMRPRFASKAFAWTLAIVLVLIVSLMLIPPARAAILEFIQIGVVRIFRTEPTPLPPPNGQAPSLEIPVTATPVSTPQPLIPILKNISGEMTLEQAQKKITLSNPLAVLSSRVRQTRLCLCTGCRWCNNNSYLD